MIRLRLEPRHSDSFFARFLPVVAGLAAGILVASALLEGFGTDAVDTWRSILEAGFIGGGWALSDTLTTSTPLILCGLGCALAFRTNLWNVGAEGQLLMGAWGATLVALAIGRPEWPKPAMLLAMATAGFLAGAAWAALPGFFKARWSTSEILTSLMLVYVAKHFNNYFIYSVWSDKGFQMTKVFPAQAWLPRLSDLAHLNHEFTGLTLHAGFPVALAAAALLWLIVHRTRFGFQIKVSGINPRTARYAGIPVERYFVVVMAFSGGLAGLAGMVEVSGVVHRLQENFSPGYGFTAILIAWLARLDPASVVLVSVLLSGLLVGARQVQPAGIAMMLQGAFLTCVIAVDFLGRYKLRLVHSAAAGEMQR